MAARPSRIVVLAIVAFAAGLLLARLLAPARIELPTTERATVLDAPREVLVSGRLSRVPWVLEQLAPRLGRFAPVRRVEGYAREAGEAAQGAALIGQGLLGGPLAALVEAMGLRSAAGTVLDHLYVEGTDDVRRRYRQSEPGPAPYWARR